MTLAVSLHAAAEVQKRRMTISVAFSFPLGLADFSVSLRVATATANGI